MNAVTESDAGFRAALDERFESLVNCIRALIEVPQRPPHEPNQPGQHSPFPPGDVAEQRLGECVGYLSRNWDLVAQFGQPSIEGARHRSSKLSYTKNEGLRTLIPGPDDNDQSIRARINNQLDGWNGDARDVADWSFGDLTTAIACQVEVIEALRSALDLHSSLLSAARGKVLLACDNAIRVLKEMNQEQDNEISTLLTEAWKVTREELGKVDFSEFMVDAVATGPAKAAAGQLTSLLEGVGIGVAKTVIAELIDFSDEDPIPVLEAMFHQVRKVREATHEDSIVIAESVKKLTEFTNTGGGMHRYALHENGPPQPPYPS